MLHGLRKSFKKRRLRSRLKSYREDLDALINGELNVKALSEELAEFWRKVKIPDLIGFSPTEAMDVTLAIHHKNLPQLIDHLENLNVYIAEERDALIEQLAKAAFAEPRTVVLDLYFADDKGRDINAQQLLRKLQSLLLCHVAILEPQEGQYYQRQSERLYQEILNITDRLVDLAIAREGVIL